MTRIETETVIIRRLKKLMQAGGLNITPSGSNLDLDDPLFTALAEMGYAAAVAPTTANVQAVTTADTNLFLVRVAINVLQTLLGNIEGSDISMSTGKTENRSQLIEQILQMLEYYKGLLAEGLQGTASASGGSILVGGRVALDFQTDITA